MQQDDASKRYRLGLRTWEIGCRAVRRSGLVDAAQPVLKWLAQVSGETSILAVLGDTDVLYLDVVAGSSLLRVCVEPGARAPAYATASGKAMLAHRPELVPRVLQAGLRRITSLTVTRPAQLRDRREDIASLAAPIFDARGECAAAVSLAGPATRFTEETLEELARHVRKAAEEISARFGCAQR